MKKLKVLAAAVSMALGTQAHAAFTSAADTTTGSTLFFIAWNTTSSYAEDLGIKLSDVLNLVTPGTVSSATGPNTSWITSGFSFTKAGTALFTSTFGAIPNITGWNIVAAGSGASGTNQFVTSIATEPGSTPNNTTVGTITTKTASFFNATAFNGGAPCSGAVAECAVTSTADPAYAGNLANWATNMGGSFGGNNAGTSTASILNFEWFKQSSTSGLAASSRALFTNGTDTGHWTLAANGTVMYSIGAAAVPLPAGVWLLGSGLLGFFAVGRRRKNSIA